MTGASSASTRLTKRPRSLASSTSFIDVGGSVNATFYGPFLGSGATPPTPQEAQLLEWTVELPDRASLDAAFQSLGRAGYPAEWGEVVGSGPVLVTHDPWGTHVRLLSRAAVGA